MKRRVVFKNMQHSEVIENFAQQKLEKVEKLLSSERTPISINLVIEGHNVHAYNKIELIISTADFKLIAHHEGSDIYNEINTVIDKMVEEIRSAKEKKAEEKKKKDYYKSV